VTQRFSDEEKLTILGEVEAAPRGEKKKVLERYRITTGMVSKWSDARDEGRFGRTRDTKRNVECDAETQLIVRRAEVLGAIVSCGEPRPGARRDLRLGKEVTTKEEHELEEQLFDKIADEEEGVLWSGKPRGNWDERAMRVIHDRVLQEKRSESRDGDWWGDLAALRPEDLCRARVCPCKLFCGVEHFHSENASFEVKRFTPSSLHPTWFLCESGTCRLNLLWCIAGFGPYHVHRPTETPQPARSLEEAKPIREWTRAEDCPWHGVCDVRHAKPDASTMRIFGVVEQEYHPIDLWCRDENCPHHRRGAPHVHCRGRKCDAVIRADCRDNELNWANEKGLDEGAPRGRVDEVGPGLCPGCRAKRMKKLSRERQKKPS